MKRYRTPRSWQVGSKAKVPCEHKNCKRFLVVTIGNPSTGQSSHSKYGSFDFRNQTWYCHQHMTTIKQIK